MTTEALLALSGRRVWVAGHGGMVGSALVRRLGREACEIVTADRADLDLRRQSDTFDWIADHRPEVVFIAAATVGGILANDERPAEFIADNLAIGSNILEGCRRVGCRKLMFLGSSCVYPKLAAQPLREDSLLSGPLEATNEAYAIAKIAGLKMARAYRRQYGLDYISVMPCNLYGPGDNFDLRSGHVLPTLLRKAHEAKEAGAATLTIWGSGTPRREFLFVDDCADALVHLMSCYSADDPINVGSGTDVTIRDLAETIGDVVGFGGGIVNDQTLPDGTPRKLLDTTRLRDTGWTPRVPLRAGIETTYQWYVETLAAA